MELNIVRADPAGNITVFVLNRLDDPAERMAAVRALLADPALQAEQVGFVLPPPGHGMWRLEMMGGEFCGNAARSFGLLIAAQTGLAGAHTLMIETSGMARPLPVHIDTGAGTARAEMPGPLAETVLVCGGRRFPAYVFEGITHAIAENMEADERLLPPLLGALEKCRLPDAPFPPDALGMMFYDTERRFMRPVVWVRSSGTTVFESSCGSGSAAMGAWKLRNLRGGEERFTLAQPGGTVEVHAVKQDGLMRRISIGGPLTLSKPYRWTGT
jgi:diaminopimelate epimerase